MRKNEFVGKKYQGNDGSVICFGENNEYIWYQAADCKDDNYFKGPYELYFAEEALEYIVDTLSQFGITKETMQAYFERNAGNDFYNLENYCCIVLHNEEILIQGELKQMNPNISYYMGFYAEGYMDIANMMTGNSAQFNRIDD